MEQEPKPPRRRAENLVRLLVPEWRPTSQQVLWATRIGIVLGLLVAIGHPYGITLWDWIKLLIVPAVIAGVGFWFNTQQREREQQIANDRAQDGALEAYLDQISQLLTDKDRPLHRAQVGDSLSSIARARTLTVLPRLDGDRKARVVQFLYESGLIVQGSTVLALGGIDLSRANLKEAVLSRAVLSGANLREADLRGTNLNLANLSFTDLRGANLSCAILLGVKLYGADLRGIDLSGADLRGVGLSLADLRGTNLAGADLKGADLINAVGITNEELESRAKTPEWSLEGATMPNGQKYEDWLKDRESRKKKG